MNTALEYISLKYLGVYLKEIWNIDKNKLDNKGKIVYNAIINYNLDKEEIKEEILTDFFHIFSSNCSCNENSYSDNSQNFISITKFNNNISELYENMHTLIINKLIVNQTIIINNIKEKISLYLEANNELIRSYQNIIDYSQEILNKTKHKEAVHNIVLENRNKINNLKIINDDYNKMLIEINDFVNKFGLERKLN